MKRTTGSLQTRQPYQRSLGSVGFAVLLLCAGACLPREHVVTSAHQEAGYRVEYLTVQTGDVNYGGTNANVIVRVFGSDGKFIDLPIDDLDRDDFERGHGDEFSIVAPALQGPIERVRVSHDNSGRYPGWFLEAVRLQGHIGDEWWASDFAANRWLAKDEGDGSLCVELATGKATISCPRLGGGGGTTPPSTGTLSGGYTIGPQPGTETFSVSVRIQGCLLDSGGRCASTFETLATRSDLTPGAAATVTFSQSGLTPGSWQVTATPSCCGAPKACKVTVPGTVQFTDRNGLPHCSR